MKTTSNIFNHSTYKMRLMRADISFAIKRKVIITSNNYVIQSTGAKKMPAQKFLNDLKDKMSEM